MKNDILDSLISHTVVRLDEMQASFGKTKLIKLLYLIDVENYRRRRKVLSGLDWYFHHYGPYAFEIEDALDDLALEISQESFKTKYGRNAVVFRPHRELRPMLAEYVSKPELNLVNKVIVEWGDVEFNPLLNHVYFYTEPMQNAKRGDRLDFSTIQRRRVSRSAPDNKMSPRSRLDEYRTRFKAAMKEHVQRRLHPTPRFDKVYSDALVRMGREERLETPPGELDISEEVKARIRKQGDEQVVG